MMNPAKQKSVPQTLWTAKTLKCWSQKRHQKSPSPLTTHTVLKYSANSEPMMPGELLKGETGRREAPLPVINT